MEHNDLTEEYSDILKKLQKSKGQAEPEKTRNLSDNTVDTNIKQNPGKKDTAKPEERVRNITHNGEKIEGDSTSNSGNTGENGSGSYIVGIVVAVTVIMLILFFLFDKLMDYREQEKDTVTDYSEDSVDLDTEDIPEQIDSTDYIHHNRVTQEFEPVRVESDFYRLTVRPGAAENEADIEGFYLSMDLENCSKDADLQMVIDSLYLNSYRVDCSGNWKLTVDEKEEFLLLVEEDAIESLGNGPYSSIVIYYSVYDTKHDVKEPVDEYCISIFPDGEEKQEKYIRGIGPMDVQIFENKDITLICTGTERDEEYNYLKFYIENKNKRKVDCILDGFEMDGSEIGGIYETKMLDAGCSTDFILSFPVSKFGDLHLADMEEISFCFYVEDENQKTMVDDEIISFKPVKRKVSHQYK